MRLRVVRGTNWKGQPGWEWTCPPCEAHPLQQIRGFSNERTWTARFRVVPSAQARAMEGARRHLCRYHRDEAS